MTTVPSASLERGRGGAGDGRRPRRLDACTILTLYLVLLVAVPAPLIFGPLGASGTPANVLGIVGFVWWLARRIGQRRSDQRRSPVSAGLLIFGLAILPSLSTMYMRGTPGVESSAANRAVLIFLGSAGVALLIIDGIQHRDQIQALFRRLILAATVLSLTGLLQAVTGFELATRLRIPGLQYNPEIEPIGPRGHFTRVQGSTSHPIEFGVVLAMVFPIALQQTLCTEPGPKRRRLALCTALIGIGVALSLSRSGIVALIVAFLVLMAGWTPRQRWNGLMGSILALAALRAAVPGLLGTLTHLFTGISSDSSTQARTSRYTTLGMYFHQYEWTGRGFGTFLPQNYIFVDNQYILTGVEMGVIGVMALITLFGTGVAAALQARRLTTDPYLASLSRATLAAVLASMVSFITYDALSFPVATGITFFLLGLAGCLHRLARAERDEPLPAGWTSGLTLEPVPV